MKLFDNRVSRRVGIVTALTVLHAVGAGSALYAADAPSHPAAEAHPNELFDITRRVGASLVKIYGTGIGLEHGYGVGICVNAQGDVVTVTSLILDSRNLRVVLPDGREVPAQVKRRDDVRQLALLSVSYGDSEKPPAPLVAGTSRQLLPCDAVLAFGNPYSIADDDDPLTLTAGVFSLRTNLDARRRSQPFSYRGEVLLFDAITSNPGMAGGPLLDARGNWIGLIGKVVVSRRTNTYVSFAMPIEEVSAFLRGEDSGSQSAAATDENGAEPWTGINLFTLGFRQNAAYVDSVDADSPAASAGLQADDLILAIDGDQVKSARDFRRKLKTMTPGQRISLAVKRGDDVLKVDLTVERKP